MPNAQLAVINGETCIWIAWNDDENIALWNKKRAAMIKLEVALIDASQGKMQPAEKVLAKVEGINDQVEFCI